MERFRRFGLLVLAGLVCALANGASADAKPSPKPRGHAIAKHRTVSKKHRARKKAKKRPAHNPNRKPARRKRPAEQSRTAPPATPAARRPATVAATPAAAAAASPLTALTPVLPSVAVSSAADEQGSSAPPVDRPSRPFAATSFWNAPLADDAPLDPSSSTYVANLQRQVAQYGPWINTTTWSTPVYTVPADQPTVHVTLNKNDPGMQAAFDRVPIPPGARPAAGGDATMVVWQPATDTMWEFWLTSLQADGWHASYGGRMDHVSTNPGYYTDHPGWGASATSLPWLGGLMRLDELKAGSIDHALALAIPEARAGVYSWPAQRTDGTVVSADAIPEGTRFRLDPTLDLSTLPMSPVVREMADAVQRYGMVVRDKAGAVTFYGEDPTPTGSDPYSGIFRGYPSTLLAQFPWSHLQALQTRLRVDPF